MKIKPKVPVVIHKKVVEKDETVVEKTKNEKKIEPVFVKKEEHKVEKKEPVVIQTKIVEKKEKVVIEKPKESVVIEPEEPVIQTKREPVVKKEETVVRREEPVVRREEPVVRREEPVVRREEPVVRREEPVIRHEEPVVRREPVVKKEEPVVVKKVEPVVRHEEPEIMIMDEPIIEDEYQFNYPDRNSVPVDSLLKVYKSKPRVTRRHTHTVNPSRDRPGTFESESSGPSQKLLKLENNSEPEVKLESNTTAEPINQEPEPPKKKLPPGAKGFGVSLMGELGAKLKNRKKDD